MFDCTKSVTRTGPVKAIKVTNPHTHMPLAIADAKGTRDRDFEGHSASNFFRAGFTRDAVKPGDRSSIAYALTHDGSDGGNPTPCSCAGRSPGLSSAISAWVPVSAGTQPFHPLDYPAMRA